MARWPVDARQQKAQQIVAAGTIAPGNGYWLVHSQTGGHRYKVVPDGLFPSCTCADFELTDKPCKHILAVRLFLEQQEQRFAGQTVVNAVPPKPKRPTYKQDWPNYNAAQNHEKDHAQELLHDLCRHIPDPPRAEKDKGGNRPVRMANGVFAACFKVWCTLSARRFMSALRTAHERGFVSKLLCHNSVLKTLENPAATPILHELIRQSSLPLKAIETTFAVDSSGFATSRFTRWFDMKYGAERQEADWVKVHVMVGTATHVATAAEILGKRAADSPQFPGLVKKTAVGFKIGEVCADAAYAGTENFQAVEDVGGTLYGPSQKICNK